MSHWVTVAVGTSLLSWCYLLVAHGQFWRVRLLQGDSVPMDRVRARIAVVIPARNEADAIASTVRSLLAQEGAEALRIFLVDDQSSDGTADLARQAAYDSGKSDALEVIPGAPLPSGWTGKLWAVQQGLDRALSANPDYVLLTDADIIHSSDNLAKLVAIARQGDYSLVSFMVKLHCRSLPERLLIPAFVFFFFMLYPPLWIRKANRRIAGAAGGCMLVRAEWLRKLGGMSSIRGEIIDDCALARAIKTSGGRVWLGVTDDTTSSRAYPTFQDVENMIARTAFNQLKHSSLILIGSLIGLFVVYLAPVFAVLVGGRVEVGLGGLSWLLMSIAYAPMVRFYGLPGWWALTLPLAASFYMVATVHSAARFWRGKGGQWKGRAQDKVSIG